MSKKNAKLIAEKLESKGLLANWLQFGPDGERIDMVLMINSDYQDDDSRIQFAHCIYNGGELTAQCPDWVKDAIGS